MYRQLYCFVFFSLLISLNCSNLQKKPVTFYISPSGNDQWSGKLAEPNTDKTDGPFATFERTQQAIRQLKQDKGLPQKGITIFIREGNYPLAASLVLTSEDAGNLQSPVIWQAFSDEKVLLTGSQMVEGFESINDPAMLKRLTTDGKSNIVRVNLTQLGITDYGQISQRGNPGLELFFQQKRMTLARYPNEGWLLIQDVPQSGTTLFNKGLDREKRYDGVPVGRHYGRIQYPGDQPANWSSDNEIYVHGYWTWDWSDSYQKVQSFDTKRHEMTLAEPHHHYGYTKNQRFYFVNILEELDQPGEWVLDRQTGWLYFWPPAPIESGEVQISMLEEPLVILENCENVHFKNIEFAFSRGNGVVINGGLRNLIAGCHFHCLGNHAVLINSGTENGITSCDIYDVSLGGVILRGGNRKTLEPGNNFVTNNHIFDYSQWVRTGQLAVDLMGVGNKIAHNLIHDGPHGAIYVRGNEHLLEYNEIYNVCYETGDAGAIHTGRNYTQRGMIYRYNYVHHLKGPGLHGVTALYLDDFTSGYQLYGNICYKSGRGVLMGGGRDNLVENNIFIHCAPSIVLDARGLSWASYYFNGQYPVLMDSMQAMNYTQPPYSEKYPELLTYNDQAAVPKGNKILRNISYKSRWIELYDYFLYDFSVIKMQNNLIADSIVCKRIKADPGKWEPYYLNLDSEDDYIYFKNGDPEMEKLFPDDKMITSEPGFENIAAENFRLKPGSPAFELGFQAIPVEKIGLYVDEYRKKLPERKRMDWSN